MKGAPGRKEIFEKLHQQYYPMVKQLCMGYVKGDTHAADDLAQDVFINIWNALDGFKNQSSYKTWIYRITVNTCLLYLRNNKKVQLVAELTDTDNAIPQTIQPDKNEYHALYHAIGTLPHLDRLIIMMLLDELSYEEIADIIGINAINLRVKIHRIKKKMGELLKQ